jgi:hypothetical protein
MNAQHGNLSTAERATSAGAAALLSLLTVRRGPPLLRILAGAAAASLALRAAAGHCAVKATLRGEASLKDALADEWRCLSNRSHVSRHGVPGSPTYDDRSARIDEAVNVSFPASDPPASRLPDEPPSNAQAKWDAARAAGEVY